MPKGKTALIVGGGPAGLFAAELISSAGFAVILADRMPSVGRKFLVAGKGGLNLTNTADLDLFVSKYGTSLPIEKRLEEGAGSHEHWRELLREFSPEALRKWALDLGVPTFVGTSERVFPETKQAAPLLRRWVQRLRASGVTFLMRHEFVDWENKERVHVTLNAEQGEKTIPCDVLILAMGGASWPQTGSNAAGVNRLEQKLSIEPFVSANCGYECAWPEGFGDEFGGTPIKNIVATAGPMSVPGELMITRYGLEGTALYALGGPLREMAQRGEKLELYINFKPDFSSDVLLAKLHAQGKPKPGELPDLAAKAWKLGAGARALLKTRPPEDVTPAGLAELVLRFPIVFDRPRPIAEAISSSGGVAWSEVSKGLELRRFPGVFCAGEMLDWEAPTGGYLMQGCFSTAARAARTAIANLERLL